jgi:hypothetical protein
MQTDTSPIAGNEKGMRLGFLVRQFHRAVERQRQHDAANLASLLRALKRGGSDAERLCELVGQLRHGSDVGSNERRER